METMSTGNSRDIIEAVGQFMVMFGAAHLTYGYALPLVGITVSDSITVLVGTAVAAATVAMMNYRSGSRWITA